MPVEFGVLIRGGRGLRFGLDRGFDPCTYGRDEPERVPLLVAHREGAFMSPTLIPYAA